MEGDQYFQGDLMFVEVSSGSVELAGNPVRSGRVVLARGEKTGHEHVVTLDTDGALVGHLWAGGQIVVVGEHDLVVEHVGDSDPAQLHSPLVLPAGKVFVVTQQRRWTPEATARVVD